MGRGRCNCGGGSGGDLFFSNDGNVIFSGDGSLSNPITADVDFPQLVSDLGAHLTATDCPTVTTVLGVSGGTVRLIDLPTGRCRKML
jgi:hypothetical protein